MSVTHAPNKKDISRLIDQNVDKLVKYFNDYQDMLAPLISKNGDPNFSYQLIDLTTNTVKKLIIYYFHLYHQEYILKKDTLKLAIVAKRYALSF